MNGNNETVCAKHMQTRPQLTAFASQNQVLTCRLTWRIHHLHPPLLQQVYPADTVHLCEAMCVKVESAEL